MTLTMRPHILSTLVSLALGALIVDAAPSNATKKSIYDSIIVFGDSFSDNGNGAWRLTNHTWPANPHYYGGRFSNGPVWNEYVAENLSLPLINYATGGATSSNHLVQGYTGPSSTIPVPSVDEQIQTFLSSPSAKNVTKPLFVVAIGANDIFFDANVTAAQSFQYIRTESQLLLSRYPQSHILTMSYPLLDHLPYGYYVTSKLNKLQLRKFSKELAELLRDGARSGGAKSPYTFLDVIPLFEDFSYYAEPAAYGYDKFGAYGSCLVGVYQEVTGNVTLCSDASKFVFWDEYHPTTRTHALIASLALGTLRS